MFAMFVQRRAKDINWVGKVHLLGHIFTSDDGFPWRSVRGRPQKSQHARFFHGARFDPRDQRDSGKVTWYMYRFDSDRQCNANATPSNPRQWKAGLRMLCVLFIKMECVHVSRSAFGSIIILLELFIPDLT